MGDLGEIHTETLLIAAIVAQIAQVRLTTTARQKCLRQPIAWSQVSHLDQHVLPALGAQQGAQLYADNCAVCHGAAGEGNRTVGAPRLNDAIWLYGGSRDAIYRSIFYARNGSMPAWGGRLDEATMKMLAIYVHALGGGR